MQGLFDRGRTSSEPRENSTLFSESEGELRSNFDAPPMLLENPVLEGYRTHELGRTASKPAFLQRPLSECWEEASELPDLPAVQRSRLSTSEVPDNVASSDLAEESSERNPHIPSPRGEDPLGATSPSCRGGGPSRAARRYCRPLPGPPKSPRAPMSTSLGHYVSPAFLWSDLDIEIEETSRDALPVDSSAQPAPAVSSRALPPRELSDVICSEAPPRTPPLRERWPSPALRLCNLADQLADLARAAAPTVPGGLCCAPRPAQSVGGAGGEKSLILDPSEERLQEAWNPIVVSPPALLQPYGSGNFSNMAEQLLSLSEVTNLSCQGRCGGGQVKAQCVEPDRSFA